MNLAPCTRAAPALLPNYHNSHFHVPIKVQVHVMGVSRDLLMRMRRFIHTAGLATDDGPLVSECIEKLHVRQRFQCCVVAGSIYCHL